jgi:hypothetical protein
VDLPFLFTLLDSLFRVDGWECDVGLFIGENEIRNGPLLPPFVKDRLLSDFEQI